MKKIFYFLLGLLLVLAVCSCEKAEDQNCACGDFARNGKHYTGGNNLQVTYWQDYINHCSGNSKRLAETRLTTEPAPEWWNQPTYCDEPW